MHKWTKSEGFLHITLDNIQNEFRAMVERDGILQTRVIESFIQNTEEILEWFQRQRTLNFYASSLLYIRGEESVPTSKVKLIDFAHVLESNGSEDKSKGYLDVIEGIENILKIWYQLKVL